MKQLYKNFFISTQKILLNISKKLTKLSKYENCECLLCKDKLKIVKIVNEILSNKKILSS